MFDADLDRTSHAYHMARREAFSTWLTASAGSKVKREVNNSKVKVSSAS